MNPIVTYIILVVATLFLATAVVFVAASTMPELFSFGSESPQSSPPQEPGQIQQASEEHRAPEYAASIPDTSLHQRLIVTLQDSVQTLVGLLQEERKRIEELQRNLVSRQAAARADSAALAQERRMKAKLLESMGPEEAALILRQLDISEAKAILLFVRAKQAGKILGLLEPEHAATMMR